MEITVITAISIGLDLLTHPWFQCQSRVDNKSTAWLDELGKMGKTLQIGLRGTIDVQMVRVGRSYHRNVGVQVMERTVKLIGLNHGIGAGCRKQEIAVVITQHTTQEGVAPDT